MMKYIGRKKKSQKCDMTEKCKEGQIMWW